VTAALLLEEYGLPADDCESRWCDDDDDDDDILYVDLVDGGAVDGLLEFFTELILLLLLLLPAVAGLLRPVYIFTFHNHEVGLLHGNVPLFTCSAPTSAVAIA